MALEEYLFRKFSRNKLFVDFGIVNRINTLSFYINTTVEKIWSACYNIPAFKIENQGPVVSKQKCAGAFNMHHNKMPLKTL